jgi:flagellar assembly protein FliH
MTSSSSTPSGGSKFTAQSSVGVSRDSVPRIASPWALDELTLPPEPTGIDTIGIVDPMVMAAERERLLEEGYRRGLAEGMAKGAQEAEKRLQEATGVLATSLAEVEKLSTTAPAALEENVAALAVIVARQIVAREVSLEPDIVADLVRRALTEFPLDQAVRIRVNPLDLSLLSGAPSKSGAVAPITGAREASWLADPRVARGGCLIEGRDRIIDGRVDTALERAYRRMSGLDAS